MQGYRSRVDAVEKARLELPVDPVYDIKMFMMKEEDPKDLEYFVRGRDFKTVPKWGQLKLMISEMMFLMLYCLRYVGATIVYAGAAPGHHINLLISYFPMFRWELYDPRKIIVAPSERVKLHQVYFTDEIAQSWSTVSNVIFITDIRTGSHVNRDNVVNEKEIWADMLRQQRWVELLKPVIGHIKFRLPYIYAGGPAQSEYLSGVIFYQPFAGPSSTECRLVVAPVNGLPGVFAKATYDNKDFESRCFYRNSVIREAQHYKDHIVGRMNVPDGGELDNRLDSMMFIGGCHMYLSKFNPNFPSLSPEDQYKYSIGMTISIMKIINAYRGKTKISLKARRLALQAIADENKDRT